MKSEKIHQLQILDKKSTNSNNLEHGTISLIIHNTEKERCQESELVEQQIPE